MAGKNSTAKGFAILSATGIASKILSLIYVPIQTAVVHDKGNGIIYTGMVVYTFMFSLSNAGLPSSIAKMVSGQEALGDYKGAKRIFRMATAVLLVLGVIASVVMALLSHKIAVWWKQDEAASMLLAISPAFLFTSVNCAVRGYFQGKKNMVPTAVSQLVEQLFNSVLTVTFICLFFYTTVDPAKKLSNAAAGSAIGTVGGAAAASVFLVYLYMSTRGRRRRQETLSTYCGPELTNRMIMRQIVLFSVPAIINSVANSASGLIDASLCKARMMEGGLSANAAADLYGQYATPYQRMISIITILGTSLMVALIPAVSSSWALRDRKALRRTLVNSYRVMFIFVLPCLAAFTVLAHPIMAAVFFNVGQKGYLFLSGWSWSNLLLIVISVQSGIMIGLGRPVAVPLNLIIGMGAKIVFNYVLVAVPAVNMNGAAVGSAAGWLITVLLDEYIIVRCSGVRVRYLPLLLKPFCVSAVMAGGAYFVYRVFNGLTLALLHEAEAARKIEAFLRGGVQTTLEAAGFRRGELLRILLCNDLGLVCAIAAGVVLYFSLLILWGGIRAADIRRAPGGRTLLRLVSKIPPLEKKLAKEM